MDWTQIITFFVGGGLGGVVAAYVAIRMLKPNIRVLSATERKIDADAASVASNALIEILKGFQGERVAFQAERELFRQERLEFEKRIDAMEAEQEIHRIARDAEIAELKARITSNGLEMQKEITALQEQVKEGNGKYSAAKKVIEKLVQALKDANIDVPDMNGGLPDSIQSWKWPPK